MNLKNGSSFGARGQRVSWSALVGYDFFISYRRSDATPNASALFEALKLADFRCFLDDNDATPGKPLTEKLQWSLKRSKLLLIIASPDLPLSTWVPKEIEIFLKTERDIILISVRGGMAGALASNTLGPLLNKDVLWIDDQSAVGPDDSPSAHVIGSVQKNFTHRKANRNLRLIAGVVTLLIAGFATLAGWQWRTALARLQIVQSEALAADARRLAPQEPFLAVKTAIAAFEMSDSASKSMQLDLTAPLVGRLDQLRSLDEAILRLLQMPDLGVSLGEKVAANVCSPEIPTKMPTNRTAAVNFYVCFQRTAKIFLKIWNQTNSVSYCYCLCFQPGAPGRQSPNAITN